MLARKLPRHQHKLFTINHNPLQYNNCEVVKNFINGENTCIDILGNTWLPCIWIVVLRVICLNSSPYNRNWDTLHINADVQNTRGKGQA